MKRLALSNHPLFLLFGIGGLLGAFCAIPAGADRVHLNDGTTLEGTVKHTSEGWDVTIADGSVVHVSPENVRLIEPTPKTTADAAEDKLASLRRSVDYMTDIKLVRERYEKFIETNHGTPIAAEALKDLGVWQDRMDRQMVKVGSRWVTPVDKQLIDEKNSIALDGVRDMIKAARYNEADPILQQILTDDSANAGALYLRGFIQAKQEQWPVARKTLEAAKEAQGGHGPTLNNLAVILWRQNQLQPALTNYEAALNSPGPGQFLIQILNNVAEAINALPPEQRNTPNAIKITKHFADLDAAVQAQMAQSGYYRWGSSWVTQAQLTQLKAAEAEIQKKLTDMQAEYDADAAHVDRIDSDVANIEQAMKRIESTSYVVGANGVIYQTRLPSAYYDDDRDKRQLQAEKLELLAKLDSLRQAAKAVQQTLPVQKYTGLQQFIGPEGTPMPAVAHVPVAPPVQANPPPQPQARAGAATQSAAIPPPATQP